MATENEIVAKVATEFVGKSATFFSEMNEHVRNMATYILGDDNEIRSFEEFIGEGNDPEAHILYSASYALFDFATVVKCLDKSDLDFSLKYKYYEKIQKIVEFAKNMHMAVVDAHSINPNI